jgi:hypothetical protein
MRSFIQNLPHPTATRYLWRRLRTSPEHADEVVGETPI